MPHHAGIKPQPDSHTDSNFKSKIYKKEDMMRELYIYIYIKTKALKYSCQTQGLRAEPSPPHHAVWPELSINLVVS